MLYSRLLRLAIATFFLSLLYACGGGGGGGSDGSATPPPGGSSNGMQAFITKANSPTIARRIIATFAIANAFNIVPYINESNPGVPVKGTFSGPDGGSVSVTGTTSTYTIKYSNFSDAGVTLNGSETVEVQSTGLVTRTKTTYKNFSISSAQSSLQLNGAVLREVDFYDLNLNMVLAVVDKQSGQVFNMDGFNINYARIDTSPRYNTTVTGRIYDEGEGWVTLSTIEPLLAESPTYNVYHMRNSTGILKAQGNGGAMQLAYQSSRYLGIALDLDNDGNFESGRRVSVDELSGSAGFPDNVAQPPRPNAGPDLHARPGESIFVKGLLSHDANREFLQYRWSFLNARFARDAQLEFTDEPVARFTAPEPGYYSLHLEVTDGIHVTEDVVEVHVFDAYARIHPQILSLGSDWHFEPGDPVMLDGYSTQNLGGGEPEMTWSLYPPAGSFAVLDSATATVASFVPDIPGYYVIQSGEAGGFFESSTANVGMPVSLLYGRVHTVNVGSSSNGAGRLIPGDVNGDGNDDFVYHSARWDFTRGADLLPHVEVLIGDATGNPTGDILALDADIGAFVLVDIDNDGIEEVVGHGNGKLHTLSFAGEPPVIESVTNPYAACANPVSSAPIAAGDVDGDGRTDVVSANTCGEIAVFQGGYGKLAVMNTQSIGPMKGAELLDTNSDGVLDLVTSYILEDGTAMLRIQRGNNDGAFGVAATHVLPGTLTGKALLEQIDYDEDGKADLLVATENRVTVFLQQADGTLLEAATLDPGVTINYTGDIVLHDFDGNGRRDILLSAMGDWNAMLFIYREEDGSFGDHVAFRMAGKVDASMSGAIVNDVNGDDIPDILVAGDGIVQFIGQSY